MGTFSAHSTNQRTDLEKCDYCGVMVRFDRMQKHILLVHTKKKKKRGPVSWINPYSKEGRKILAATTVAPPQRVHASDFDLCPLCGMRILKERLEDHKTTGCENRGKISATKLTIPWANGSYDDHWRPW